MNIAGGSDLARLLEQFMRAAPQNVLQEELTPMMVAAREGDVDKIRALHVTDPGLIHAPSQVR